MEKKLIYMNQDMIQLSCKEIVIFYVPTCSIFAGPVIMFAPWRQNSVKQKDHVIATCEILYL